MRDAISPATRNNTVDRSFESAEKLVLESNSTYKAFRDHLDSKTALETARTIAAYHLVAEFENCI